MSGLPTLAREKWLRKPSLRRLFRVIREAGGDARVAGGAVRNALLGVPVADVDLATTLAPDGVMAICAAAGMSVHPTGIDHGTVTAVVDGDTYEVTTLRRDVETDGRRATVEFTGNWQADAVRRDFTMNALYCDEEGKLFDYVGGYEDTLKKRVIFVGTPDDRIREDYLRILRFFRFHARFGRGRPHQPSLVACVKLRAGLDALSGERIRQEMFKLLAAPGAVPTLKLMAAHGILDRLLAYRGAWRVMGRLPPDPMLRLAALAEDATLVRSRWRLSNDEADRLTRARASSTLSPHLRPREQRIALYQTGASAWRDLVQLAHARSRAPLDDRGWNRLLRLPDRWPLPHLPVNGHDMIAAGLAGPEIGETLRRLEDWWMASDFKPAREQLLQRVNRPDGRNDDA